MQSPSPFLTTRPFSSACSLPPLHSCRDLPFATVPAPPPPPPTAATLTANPEPYPRPTFEPGLLERRLLSLCLRGRWACAHPTGSGPVGVHRRNLGSSRRWWRAMDPWESTRATSSGTRARGACAHGFCSPMHACCARSGMGQGGLHERAQGRHAAGAHRRHLVHPSMQQCAALGGGALHRSMHPTDGPQGPTGAGGRTRTPSRTPNKRLAI